MNKEELRDIHSMLKARVIHPAGKFDKAGRFYLNDADLVNVRSPSRRYPYSHMQAGRTLKFVTAVANKYECKTKSELLAHFVEKN